MAFREKGSSFYVIPATKQNIPSLEMRVGESVERIDAKIAGYLELPGAQKDGDCVRVKVAGGVSKRLGCCNLFEPDKGVKLFSCGTCEYVRERGARKF